ncbi:MAG: hypothetical protein ACXWQ5_00385 [Ktedonobacterales bacterium]
MHKCDRLSTLHCNHAPVFPVVLTGSAVNRPGVHHLCQGCYDYAFRAPPSLYSVTAINAVEELEAQRPGIKGMLERLLSGGGQE